ncbi:MAG TPA: pseudouridine synthase [Flavobacterium sp.]|nr:pseudouridine synthase [Flavobacterium sp.]
MSNDRAGKRNFSKGGSNKPNSKNTNKPQSANDDKGMRLNKYIANSGMCSRRDADLYIRTGNVTVNGKVITEMGYRVQPKDVVQFDGATILPEKKVYVLLNKPKGFSTSSAQDNVRQLIRNASTSELFPIGFMDKTTLGLLLFTNDQDMIQKFTNSAQRSSKIYQVSLDRNCKKEDLEKIKNGVKIDDNKVYVEAVEYVENKPKTEVGIEVKTSNIKIVRKLFEVLGYDVVKLDRVTFAGLTKWGISRGQWRFLTEQEVINLKNSK